MGAVGVTNTTINATCVKGMKWCDRMQVALIAALAPMLVLIWSAAVVVVVVCCWCIPLQLVLAVFFLSPIGANTPFAHVVVSPAVT